MCSPLGSCAAASACGLDRTKPELRRLLGLGTRIELDDFLKAYDVSEP
jgi:hypothetical protein